MNSGTLFKGDLFMMKFLLPLALLSVTALAETSSEEAIILNQELQFLENSTRDIRVEPKVTEAEEDKSADEMSLERAYFGTEEKDEIRTRAAAPKRVRSF
jgi:hypothetical protein